MNPILRLFFLANEGLAFFLELAALAALARWGWTRDIGRGWSIGLAVAAPLAAAVLWGMFAAPKATFDVPLAVQIAVKVLVFGSGPPTRGSGGGGAGGRGVGGLGRREHTHAGNK
ncbi:DUF2568 domain-containing protein, partial [Streptomyces sp. NPDC059385]|uniref:DUF2568 domain-containing protein n=1 Tax=Streptomyces sp. NPDC059385 TaxID=3346817 RepID=UPI00367368E3